MPFRNPIIRIKIAADLKEVGISVRFIDISPRNTLMAIKRGQADSGMIQVKSLSDIRDFY